MSAHSRRFDLAELEAARHHLARCKELIEEQKERISRLILLPHFGATSCLMIWMRPVMASSASSPSQLMALADGPMVVMYSQSKRRLCRRLSSARVVPSAMAAVCPDPPQLPGLRS